MSALLGLPKHNKPRLYMALYLRPNSDPDPSDWKLAFDPALKIDPALRYDTGLLLLLPKDFDPKSNEHVAVKYNIGQEIPSNSAAGLVWKFHARKTRATPTGLCALMFLGKIAVEEDVLRGVVERVALPPNIADEVKEAMKTRSRRWVLDVIMVRSYESAPSHVH